MSFYTPTSQGVRRSGCKGMSWACTQKVAMLGIFVIMKLFCILIVMVVIQIDPDDKTTYNCVHTDW